MVKHALVKSYNLKKKKVKNQLDTGGRNCWHTASLLSILATVIKLAVCLLAGSGLVIPVSLWYCFPAVWKEHKGGTWFSGMYPLWTRQLTWQFPIVDGPSNLSRELVVAIVDGLASWCVMSIIYGLAESYGWSYLTGWPGTVREVITPCYIDKLS